MLIWLPFASAQFSRLLMKFGIWLHCGTSQHLCMGGRCCRGVSLLFISFSTLEKRKHRIRYGDIDIYWCVIHFTALPRCFSFPSCAVFSGLHQGEAFAITLSDALVGAAGCWRAQAHLCCTAGAADTACSSLSPLSAKCYSRTHFQRLRASNELPKFWFWAPKQLALGGFLN